MNSLLLALLLPVVFGLPVENNFAGDDQGVSTWSPDDPVVTIINTSSQDKAYNVETASDAPASAFQKCTGCITVGAGKTIRFHPGPFTGALTANQHTATRHEFNFVSPMGSAWFNDDMEMGMSDETLGPSDSRNKIGSTESAVAGEPDTLAKANAAWSSTESGKQQALLDSGYFAGNSQRLTMVRMDKSAPQMVVSWLQMDANFNAYVGPGSIEGKLPTAVDKVSDKKTTFLQTNKLTITIFN